MMWANTVADFRRVLVRLESRWDHFHPRHRSGRRWLLRVRAGNARIGYLARRRFVGIVVDDTHSLQLGT